MPRDHARIQTKIWTKRDFRLLSCHAQHLYFTILSQPTLSYCGRLDWWPNRLAALCSDSDEGMVYAAVKELVERDFVVLDADTSELLVRTYVRHDGVLTRKNMGKATARALELVTSLDIRDAVMAELARCYREDKTLAGWEGFAEQSEDVFAEIKIMASRKRGS